jgi:zona occludens toxin (predicted ATPase)
VFIFLLLHLLPDGCFIILAKQRTKKKKKRQLFNIASSTESLKGTQAASPINVTLWKWTEIEIFMCMVLVSILMSTWTLKGFTLLDVLYFFVRPLW